MNKKRKIKKSKRNKIKLNEKIIKRIVELADDTDKLYSCNDIKNILQNEEKD